MHFWNITWSNLATSKCEVFGWQVMKKSITVIVMDMVRESAGIKATSSKKKSKDNCVWVKPPNSSLKFNIDGAARRCPGPSGIGGALRNHNGYSSNTVKRVNHPSSVPWRFKGISNQINSLKKKCRCWSVIHTLREANHLSD
ncbi:Uncharacterized protein TCM_027223 [Theobroma cacao]|uniref:RNase H type-1 domain-containing protein n=1 Tax=Theobroma cacao TaxID=3641 RepID=A0A061G8W0_THECC|nr:Uncharacterized protein TCM_027223 [Theobroma cacao]